MSWLVICVNVNVLTGTHAVMPGKITITSVYLNSDSERTVQVLTELVLTAFVTPRAHARSGVKQSVLSVSQSSVRRKKLKSPHIDPHKPSKWSQTTANSKKNLLYMYLTEVKALGFAAFRLFPILFITIHNIGSTSS